MGDGPADHAPLPEGDTAGRVAALKSVIGSRPVYNFLYPRGFVLMEYFGYLRRDPEPAGFQFWLDVLNNKVPGNFRSMVCAFITSREYQLRFAPIATHADSECQ